MIFCAKGCDGLILLDDTIPLKGEKKAATNIHSLKGFGVVDNIKNFVESECPGIVSCADILTIAARDAMILVKETKCVQQILVIYRRSYWNL